VPDPVWLQTLVELSFLRRSGDTKAQRRFVEMLRQPDPDARAGLIDRLADALEIPPEARPALIGPAERDAQQALAQARVRGIAATPFGDEAYPDLLNHLPDPPFVLWTKGDAGFLNRPAVAVVGSRAASPGALATARVLGRGLAAAGVTVVSGLALGVDGAAHRGALEAGGTTVAVLGCGVDLIYPAEHHTLVREVLERGAIVSELPPGTPPMAWHFPLRNRIISGLSLAVVVVEATFKSGSLITARAALEQGRSVLAVPGEVAAGRHRGCHALIKDGARLVETTDDILEEIGWPSRPESSTDQGSKSSNISQLERSMAVGEACSVDDLAARTGRAGGDLLAELGVLEVAGRVERLAGGTYVRLD
jgi:DNA processing protein